jgi:hypothetical protein
MSDKMANSVERISKMMERFQAERPSFPKKVPADPGFVIFRATVMASLPRGLNPNLIRISHEDIELISGSTDVESTKSQEYLYVFVNAIVVAVPAAMPKNSAEEKLRSAISGLNQQLKENFVNYSAESTFFRDSGSELAYALIIKKKTQSVIRIPVPNWLAFPSESKIAKLRYSTTEDPKKSQDKMTLRDELKKESEQKFEKDSAELRKTIETIQQELEQISEQLDNLDSYGVIQTILKSKLVSKDGKIPKMAAIRKKIDPIVSSPVVRSRYLGLNQLLGKRSDNKISEFINDYKKVVSKIKDSTLQAVSELMRKSAQKKEELKSSQEKMESIRADILRKSRKLLHKS